MQQMRAYLECYHIYVTSTSLPYVALYMSMSLFPIEIISS